MGDRIFISRGTLAKPQVEASKNMLILTLFLILQEAAESIAFYRQVKSSSKEVEVEISKIKLLLDPRLEKILEGDAGTLHKEVHNVLILMTFCSKFSKRQLTILLTTY